MRKFPLSPTSYSYLLYYLTPSPHRHIHPVDFCKVIPSQPTIKRVMLYLFLLYYPYCLLQAQTCSPSSTLPHSLYQNFEWELGAKLHLLYVAFSIELHGIGGFKDLFPSFTGVNFSRRDVRLKSSRQVGQLVGFGGRKDLR